MAEHYRTLDVAKDATHDEVMSLGTLVSVTETERHIKTQTHTDTGTHTDAHNTHAIAGYSPHLLTAAHMLHCTVFLLTQIKRAFRKMAQKYHPDLRHAASEAEKAAAEAKFKQASAAYEVLGDVMKRRDYDRSGQSHNGMGQGYRTGGAASQPRYPQWTPQHQAAMRPKVPLSQMLGRASLLGIFLGVPFLIFMTAVGGVTDSVWDHFNQGKALKKVADDRARRAAGAANSSRKSSDW